MLFIYPGWTEGLLRLGLAYMQGNGVKKDISEALKYLTMASKEHAVGFGNLLAFWYMAEIYANSRNGISQNPNSVQCMRATSYYKYVAENGQWNKLFTHAWKQWSSGQITSAMAMFSFLAELGYEKAQSNLATILDDYEIGNDVLETNQYQRYLTLTIN